MGNPWEIVRNDVSYPVKFYGNVLSGSDGSDGKKHWVGGEDIMAVAYDVPIPGYKTKTTINLRLWSTKAVSEDFDLYAFNSGEHTKACEALASAEKVWIYSSLYKLFFYNDLDYYQPTSFKTLTTQIVWGHVLELLKLGNGVE
jgi:glucan phosphorylase